MGKDDLDSTGIEKALRSLHETGGAGFVEKMLSRFIENYPGRVDRLTRAASVLDYATLAQEAHNLKSVVAIYGANGLADRFRALENAGKTSDPESSKALAATALTQMKTLKETLEAYLAAKR